MFYVSSRSFPLAVADADLPTSREKKKTGERPRLQRPRLYLSYRFISEWLLSAEDTPAGGPSVMDEG